MSQAESGIYHEPCSLFIDSEPVTTYPELLLFIQSNEWVNEQGVLYDADRIGEFVHMIANQPWNVACKLNISKHTITLVKSIKMDADGYESVESVDLWIPNLNQKLTPITKTDSAESIIQPNSANRAKPQQYTISKCPTCQQVVHDKSDEDSTPEIHESNEIMASQKIIKIPDRVRFHNKVTIQDITNTQPTPATWHGRPKSRLTKGSRRKPQCPKHQQGKIPQLGTPEFDGIINQLEQEDFANAYTVHNWETDFGNDSDDLPVSIISSADD